MDFFAQLDTEQLVGVSLTGALITGLIALLRLYGSGTDRIDRAAELRVLALLAELSRLEARHETERQRWAARETELLMQLHPKGPTT